MPSPADELSLAKELDKSLKLADVNAAAREMITDKNQVVTIYGPTKNGFAMPTSADIENTILATQKKTYAAHTEAALPAALMAETPTAGKIVSEEAAPHGYTLFTLSNGMRVYVRQTDFEADHITMRLFSLGGKSLYPDADVPNLTYLTSAVTAGGVASYDASTLNKMLASKSVRVQPYIADDSEGITASANKASLTDMMQLTHLYFTAPRKDEKAFASLMEKQRAFLLNRAASPNVAYNDSLKIILYGKGERTAPVTISTLERVNLDRVMQIYGERFADASDFTAIITGSASPEELRSLICTYLASLPATHSAEKPGSHQLSVRPVSERHYFERTQATPVTTTNIFLTAPLAYTADNNLKLDVLSQLLRMVYTEKVREEKGGTYGVSVQHDLQRYPRSEAMLKVSFRTDPAKYAELIPIIYAELERMAKEGPSQEALDKVKEYEVKTYGQVERLNDYWAHVLYTQLYAGADLDTDYLTRVKALTPADLRHIARQLLSAKRSIEVTMSTPQEK